MDTISAFINKRVKLIDGLTMAALVQATGLSKAKFYRCMAEPSRFDDSDLETIARVLGLDTQDQNTLMEYKHGSSGTHTLPERIKSENEAINKVIDRIILGKTKNHTLCTDRIFKFFHTEQRGSETQLKSAEELVDMLCTLLYNGDPLSEKLLFDATIFNSCADHAARSIVSLAKVLGQKPECRTHYSISCQHIVNDSDMDREDLMEALTGIYKIASAFTFCNHAILFENINDTFLGNANCCLIHFQDLTKKDRYFLLNFVSADEVAVYAFSDRNLYAYLSYQYATLKSKLIESIPQKPTFLSMADYIIKQSKKAPNVLLTYNLCIENVPPELWSRVRTKYENNPESLEKIKQQADPNNNLTDFPIQYFINKLIDCFKARFDTAERNNRHTILSAVGLNEFAQTGTTSELKPAGVQFDDEDILAQLHYLRDHVGKKSAAGQSYYLIQDSYNPPDVVFQVFDQLEIGIYFHENLIHSFIWVLLQKPEIAAEFYRHVTEDLLDAERRQAYDSILLSDKRAEEYIQMLIEKVRKRIDKTT